MVRKTSPEDMRRRRTAEMRRRRACEDGNPVPQQSGYVGFGRYVQRALDQYGISQETLANTTGISRETISKLVTGKSGCSADVAFRIGQALQRLGVQWSSGLLALAAAGSNANLLGVCGRLMSLGPIPCIEKNLRMLQAAPWISALEPILDHRSFLSSRLDRWNCDLDETNRIYDVIDAQETARTTIERRRLRANTILPEAFAEYVSFFERAHLTSVEIDETSADEFLATCDAAWKQWQPRNDRTDLPEAFRRAISQAVCLHQYRNAEALRRAPGRAVSLRQYATPWQIVRDDFFSRVKAMRDLLDDVEQSHVLVRRDEFLYFASFFGAGFAAHYFELAS